MSLIKDKSWLVEKFVDCEKITGLCLPKMKLHNKTNTNVETIKIYISKTGAKT